MTAQTKTQSWLFWLSLASSAGFHVALAAYLLLPSADERMGAIDRQTTAISINLESTDVLDAIEQSQAAQAAGQQAGVPGTVEPPEETPPGEAKLEEPPPPEETRPREAKPEKPAQAEPQSKPEPEPALAEPEPEPEPQRDLADEEAERQRLEAEALEQARLEAEKQEAARREAERREAERLERERQRLLAQEQERQRREAERREAEAREAEQLAREQKQAEAREAQRQERLEAQRRERAEKRREAEREARRQRQQERQRADAGASGSSGAQSSQGRVSASSGSIRNYGSMVRSRIARNKPAGGARGRVVVAFAVSPSGSLVSARIASSSGNPSLDRSALAAVRRSAPFPQPPQGARGSQLRFTMPFDFVK